MTKHCYFCNNNVPYIDYKEIETLKRFLDPHAKVVGHRKGHLCSLHQRKLSTAVKRARFLALIPFASR